MPARRVRDTVNHDGKVYFTVGGASRAIGTTTAKVRALMGRGLLEWAQFKVNGKLMVSSESLVAYMKTQPIKQSEKKPRPPAHQPAIYYKWKGALDPLKSVPPPGASAL